MNDEFRLIFEAENVGGVISAHVQIAAAQDSVSASAVGAAAATATASAGYIGAARATDQFNSSLRDTVIQAGLAFAAMTKLEDSYLKFARTVMDVRDITGASTKEATQAVVLSRVAGMPDSTALREILRSGASAFRGQGQTALSELGIAVSPTETGLKLINDISSALQNMPDSIRKASIEEQLFGARGVAALQPLLRLTQQQREETMRLAGDFNGAGLESAQQLSYSFNLLGQTMLQDFVFPIAQQVLPLVQGFVTTVIDLTSAWHDLDNELGGIPSWIAGFFALSFAVATVGLTVGKLVTAFESLIAVEAIADALQGPVGWGKLAAGAAVGAGALYGLSRAFGSDSPSSRPADTFKGAVDRFGEHVTAMKDAVSELKGDNIPRALNTYDVGVLSQSMALKAIG